MIVCRRAFYIQSVTELSHEVTTTRPLSVGDLTPYWTITVLQSSGEDPAADFRALRRFLRRSAVDQGRNVSVTIDAEIVLEADDAVDDLGTLRELGFSNLYGISRVATSRPAWATGNAELFDVANQLTLAVMRNKLIAVTSEITTGPQFERWVHRELAPFRFIPADVMTNAFSGDAKMLWARGVHRRRITKADSKALGGMRVQETLNTLEDSSFALTAAKVDYQPDDDQAVLRANLTVSGKSRVSWKRPSTFAQFLDVTVEALDTLEKCLTDGEPLDPLFPELARPETDLSRVRGAFDISVTDPDQIRSEPDAEEETIARAELLRDAVLEVRGDSGSARAEVDVGYGGIPAGTLSVTPVENRGGFCLDVRYVRPPALETVAREIKDAIQDGDLLTVYYESGHAFTSGQISKQQLVSRPFPNIVFGDFTGFSITKEKPAARGDQAMHDAIGKDGDDSLFAWVMRRYSADWLLCDDGAGEVADFLHLADNGTLTAVHVKAADNASRQRRIAVTRFEQVVSQAEKNIRELHNEVLVEHLRHPRIARPAVWHDGVRAAAGDFVEQLESRVASDKTNVVIVQPHLLKSVHDDARAADDAGHPNRNSYSIMLLDNLLHSTRRTITAQCDDLTVIGCL